MSKHDPYHPSSFFDAPRSADPGLPAEPDRPRPSGLGVASFVIAIGVGIIEFGSVAAATVLTVQAQGRADPKAPAMIVAGLGILGGLPLALIGFGLGIGALFQPGRRRTLAILGLTFNALVLLGVLGLLAIGLLVGRRG